MRSHSITVAGIRLKIRSDADEKKLKDLASELTKQFSEIKGTAAGREQEFKSMAMLALKLLDDVKTERAEKESIKNAAKQFAKEMVEKIDEVLSRDEL